MTPETKNAYEKVRGFLAERPVCPGLLLWGNTGTGKTHLAYAACNYVRENGGGFMFRRVPDVMKELRGAIQEQKRREQHFGQVETMGLTADELLTMYAGRFLLVLDDLGAHQQTEYAAAVLYDIIDARYRKHVPTIVTTNFRPDQVDDRIASRLLLGTVECGGKDLRAVYG